MRPTRVLGLIVVGLAGAWSGYWIGHALGWSRDADWPWSLGAGGGAIVLSIAAAISTVIATIAFMTLHPIIRARRLARIGQHVEGLLLEIHDTGLSVHRHGALLHQSEMELEVHPEGTDPYLAHTRDYLNDRELAHLLPGSAVALRFDPNHPKRVAIEHDVILN